MHARRCLALAALAVLVSGSAFSVSAQDQLGTRPTDKNMIPETFTPPTHEAAVQQPPLPLDYEKRVVMIPMRDGTKLYTVIVIPKGAKNAPILLTRTCYNAAARAHAARTAEPAVATGRRPAGGPAVKPPASHMLLELNQSDEVYV